MPNMPGKPGEQPQAWRATRQARRRREKARRDEPDEGPKTIPHPTKPPKAPNPDEFKIHPNKNGEYSFNFNNQPWPSLLQWLADISAMDLDYQEMPDDYVNISTPAEKGYKVAEVRNLLNQLLLARGFTLLSHGKTLSLANVKKLDLSLVRASHAGSAEELKDQQSYAFVKVSFSLDRMTAMPPSRN